MESTFEQWTNRTARFFGQTTHWFIAIFERTSVAVWLFLLYSLAMFLALATSTAFHLQSQIAESASEEQIQKVITVRQKLRDLEDQQQSLRWEIEEIKQHEMFGIAAVTNSVLFADQDFSSESNVTGKSISRDGNSNTKIISNNLQIASIEKKISVIKQDPVFSEENAPIRELANDLMFLNYISPLFASFVTMPIHLLTLLLTLSMGALGSVIHLTWEFFELHKKPLSYYLFRPFLGAILAFSIYILLKSGQMVLISPDGNSGENLNPYFISLLAIVSGMLSKQAYQRISDAGNRLLRPADSETKRWIRQRVAVEAMEERGRTKEGFARYVGATGPHVDAWMSGEEPLSQHDQDMLSAWLDVPGRDLFTDLPPAASETPRQQPAAGQQAEVDPHGEPAAAPAAG